MSVLITGASRGIGRALFDHYHAIGTTVIGTCRGQPTGPDWIQLDVTDPDSCRDLSAQLDGRPVELLICNAGVFLDRNEQLADGFAPQLWADTMATNVTGVFLTIQSLLVDLQTAKLAKIAIISSQMGSSERASGGAYIYRASKAAVANLGHNLAHDLAPSGISVGVYHPGWVRTDMGGSAAAVSPRDSAKGLAERFAALSLDTTGCFEDWTGAPMPY